MECRMCKIFMDLIRATDESGMLKTTQAERDSAYNTIVKNLSLVLEAYKSCQDARKRGEGTPILDKVESLLYAALNG